jgi:regulator of replication initiation timing
MTIPPISTKGLMLPLSNETQRASYSAIAQSMNDQIADLQRDNKIQKLEITELKSALDSLNESCRILSEENQLLRSRLTRITNGVRSVTHSMSVLMDDVSGSNSIFGLGDK